IAAKSARENPEGSNYQRAMAVVLSAFTMEAYLNYLGQELTDHWEQTQWQPLDKKLGIILDVLQFKADLGRRPFQTIKDIFEFRNRFANGKTETYKVRGIFDGTEIPNTDPPWIKKFSSDDSSGQMVQRVLEDVDQIMEEMQRRAGLPEIALNHMNHADLGVM